MRSLVRSQLSPPKILGNIATENFLFLTDCRYVTLNIDNNNKILEKYLPKAIPISILALITFSITIFIITYLINGFTHLNLFSLFPIPFVLHIHFDSKENREKYINLVRSQEEHFSVKFSDVGVERIGNTDLRIQAEFHVALLQVKSERGAI